MKNILFAGILIFGYQTAFTQNIFLREDKIITGDETVNGWIFSICDDEEFAKDDFKKFAKDKYDLKLKKKNKFTGIAEEVTIKNVSTKRGDLLVSIQHSDSGNVMGIAFVLGYDIFLNSKDNEQEMSDFRDMAKSFINYHYNSYYGEKIDDLDKEVQSAMKDLNKCESEISSLKKKELNLDKKLSKEDDAQKRQKLEKEVDDLSRDVDKNIDILPAKKEKLEDLKKERDKYKEDFLKYQSQIKLL